MRMLHPVLSSRISVTAGVLVLFLVAALLPRAWLEGLPLCAFHAVTGWDCPGCGLTRAFSALFHGRWGDSLGYHAAAIPLAAYFAVYAADGLYTWRRGRRPDWYSMAGSRWITALFGVLIFGQWIYKSGHRLYTLM